MENQIGYIALASLNQYAFCPHRCWRMFCAGEFEDNQYTLEGTNLHERVHRLGENVRDEMLQIRAIWLKSERYQLIGKADLIECQDGYFYPVEYKRGDRGKWGNDELQLCAQALCLEEMTGQAVREAYIYYAQSHQRQPVLISDSLREATVLTIAAVRSLMETGKCPKPIYSPKCKGCSLYKICLPQAADKLQRYIEAF